MKQMLITIALIGIALTSNAQEQWTPKAKTTTVSNTQTQCWGTTVKNARCKKHTGNSESGVIGSDNHWYCSYHKSQAPIAKIAKK